MAHAETGFVVVKKSWFNTPGIYQLIGDGRESNSSSEAHMLIGPVVDASDHRGACIVETRRG